VQRSHGQRDQPQNADRPEQRRSLHAGPCCRSARRSPRHRHEVSFRCRRRVGAADGVSANVMIRWRSLHFRRSAKSCQEPRAAVHGRRRSRPRRRGASGRSGSASIVRPRRAARRARRDGRRDRARSLGDRRVDADGREHASREDGWRRGLRRHVQPERRLHVPRDPGGQGHGASPDHRSGGAGAGIARANRSPRRRRERACSFLSFWPSPPSRSGSGSRSIPPQQGSPRLSNASSPCSSSRAPVRWAWPPPRRSLSSVSVLTSSLRLRRFGRPQSPRAPAPLEFAARLTPTARECQEDAHVT
jgi:hypothetical protein